MIAIALALMIQDVGIGDFEDGVEGWALYQVEGGTFGEDSGSTLAVSREPARVKTGKGSLSYVHEVVPGTLRLLAYTRELDLKGMKSLRFSVRSSAATSVVISLAERSGASWQCAVSVRADVWETLRVNLDEFTVDEPGKDDNGKLDLDAVTGLHVFDIAGFLSVLLPELKGVRTLNLDDVAFSAESAPFTTGPTPPAYVIDTFESAAVRWAPLSVTFGDSLKLGLFDAPLTIDAGAPEGGGKQSLKFTAPRPAGKVHGVLRNLEKIDLAKAGGLELWVRTSADGTYLVNVEEKDGSRYDHVVQLAAADGWKKLSLPWADFKLADDSRDENGLDAGELKQLLVADATSLLGGSPGDDAVLRIDEVRFLLR